MNLPKGLLQVKTLWKFKFLACFSKEKRKKCDQKGWNDFGQFSVNIACSATYYVEVSAGLSLKVATKVSVRDRNTLKI